jgi:hypothetical protein
MAPDTAALTTAVDAAVGVPVGDLGVAELQDRLTEMTGQRNRLDGWLSAAAGQLQVLTGGTVVTPEGRGRSVAGWLGEATRTSSQSAGALVAKATALRQLPLVVDAVLEGVLTQEQAAVLARLVGKIAPDSLLESQADLILVAAQMDPVQLGQHVAHLIATHCEPALDAEEAAAYDKRQLLTREHADGSLSGRFRLARGEAEPFLTAVEALARRQGDEDRRTAAQRRADALADLAERSLRHDTDLGEHGGLRPQISYVLPADWAARQGDRAQCPVCSRCLQHRPATVADTVAATLPGMPAAAPEHACATAAWTGPATRARMEALLCDARISRVLLCERGQVTGLQPLRDTVTKAQRRALAARDLGCAARGCTRPPAMCDAHHLVHRADGGGNELDNLVLLCRRHHVLWHLGTTTLVDLHVPWHPEQSGADPPAA